MTDFFKNDNPNMDQQNQSQAPEKVKVGDREFSYEELQDLVSKGSTVKDFESKYSTKLDRLMPEYTKATQKLKEYEPQVEELRAKVEEYERRQNPQDGEMSDEEKIAVLERAAKIGLITEQNLASRIEGIIDKRFTQLTTANQKVSETRDTVEQYNNEFGIEATVNDVLTFMAQEGIKNPKYAIEQMFSDRLTEIKAEKAKQRDEEFITQGSSNLGSKQYRANIDYKDKATVQKALREVLRGEQ